MAGAYAETNENPVPDKVEAATSQAAPDEPAHTGPSDVIARVGDQTITFTEINTALNSAAVVGVSVPTFGTPERDVVRLTLLDKLISANLIYLDALDRGVDKDPEYQRVIEQFSDAILASLYREQYLAKSAVVGDDAVEAYYKSSMSEGSELDDDKKTAIRSILRKERLKESKREMTEQLRQGHTITVNEAALEPAGEQERPDSQVVASLDGESITWGEVKNRFLGPVSSGSMDKRRAAVEKIIDYRLILQAAKAARLENNPQYRTKVGEFNKTRLINYHRQKLLAGMAPTDEEIAKYYEEYADRIMIPEARKVQMLVVNTKEEAESIKQKIDSGELSMAKAVAQYSIVPDAKTNLGEIGWVNKGSGFPELDALTFSLDPNEIGGPVQSPAGWHLVLVLDQRDASHESLDSPGTKEKIRAGMVEDRLNKYTVDLRTSKYDVEVYNDVITELARNEAEWFRELSEKSDQSQEKLMEQIKGLQ
jgi:parvulin-like peptidyl-prolyl isomerase